MTCTSILKTVAGAALLGAGLAAAGATSASADTFRTRCFGDDCYQQRCDDFGFDCVNIAYQGHGYRPEDGPYYGDPPVQSRWVCDADGDNCHWARIYHYDYEEDYDGD